MKKGFGILETSVGLIIFLGGLFIYGLGIHQFLLVPRPDLVVVGTTLIGGMLIVAGACDLFIKKQKK